jgi:hypothetical protein
MVEHCKNPKQVMDILYPHIDSKEAVRAVCGEEYEAWKHCQEVFRRIQNEKNELQHRKKIESLKENNTKPGLTPPEKYIYPEEDEL